MDREIRSRIVSTRQTLSLSWCVPLQRLFQKLLGTLLLPRMEAAESILHVDSKCSL
jgi:hypothetical protein